MQIDEQGRKVRSAGSAEASCDRTVAAPSRPRLKERYDAEVREQLKTDLGLDNVMQVPRLEKIVVNMGVGRATQQQSLIEGAQRDLETITGQKPVVTRAKQVDRRLQAPRGPGHRRQGHAPGRPGVGVLRPADQPGHPPDPGLPGPLVPVVRRPRQLHVRRHRAADLPRDRLRPHRHDPGHGHHDRHHRTHRRGRPRVPTGVRLPVPTGDPLVTMAKKALIQKQQRTPKFKVRGYTRAAVRAPEGRVPQVRAVPDLPADHGARRGGPRRDEGELVGDRP